MKKGRRPQWKATKSGFKLLSTAVLFDTPGGSVGGKMRLGKWSVAESQIHFQSQCRVTVGIVIMRAHDKSSSVKHQLGGCCSLETMTWGIMVVMRTELQYLATGSAGLAIDGGVGKLQVNHDDFQVAGLGAWVIMGSYPLRESRSQLSVEKVMGWVCTWGTGAICGPEPRDTQELFFEYVNSLLLQKEK